jgi:GNAT superfamily N-acetyltransferase
VIAASFSQRPDREAARQALAVILDDAAAGSFPPADGGVTLLAQPSDRDAGVIAFTAHAVVFADVPPEWLRARLPADDLAAPMSSRFLEALAARLARVAGSHDMLTCATALPGPAPVDLTPVADRAHPRVARALQFRDDVRAWKADGGVVLLGRGVAGRWEVAVEVDPGSRGRGIGRALVAAARHLVPGRSNHLWAQVAPGNAASVRAFLAAGYRPVGAETLVTSRPEGSVPDAR